ncbi:WD40-repeat-containing domain protein [Dissophora ornata]|nr:WD40-repeat-containing domain protein [Dissophora ornata]
MTTESPTRHHSHPTAKTSTSAPAPPTPSFIFRGHDAPVQALEFFASNTFLATGDEAGWICVWDVWRRRQVHRWHGHPTGSVLALKAIPFRPGPENISRMVSSEPTLAVDKGRRRKSDSSGSIERQDQAYIVSHGRDNEIHVWDINTILQKSIKRADLAAAHVTPSANSQDITPVFSLPVNALNFCKLSILAIEVSPRLEQEPEISPLTGACLLSRTHQHIYIAVPSPTTATLLDIYDIVKPERTFASVGQQNKSTSASASLEADKKLGSAMAIQLFQARDEVPDSSAPCLNKDSEVTSKALQMLVGYEDGSVTLFRESTLPATERQRPTGAGAKQKRKMDILWTIRCHREPVLALDISHDMQYAVSCGSDNVLARYNLAGQLQGVPEVTQIALKSNGIADIKIRSDNKIIGLAGWDGRIRVFSAKTLKPLAVLKYHREGLYCLAFAVVRDRKPSAEGIEVEQTRATSSDETRGGSKLSSSTTGDGDRDPGSEGNNMGESESEGDDSGSDSDEGSDLEDALEGRRVWSKRHWIAAGGKENRVSLWEMY